MRKKYATRAHMRKMRLPSHIGVKLTRAPGPGVVGQVRQRVCAVVASPEPIVEKFGCRNRNRFVGVGGFGFDFVDEPADTRRRRLERCRVVTRSRRGRRLYRTADGSSFSLRQRHLSGDLEHLTQLICFRMYVSFSFTT